MKKAYIAVSYQHRHDLENVLDTISKCIQEYAYQPIIFLRDYQFEISDNRLMMQKALDQIKQCDLFIAEVTHKAIGIGIEAGYAHANQIPIVYLRAKQAKLSTTLAGISEYDIVYDDGENLRHQLERYFRHVE